MSFFFAIWMKVYLTAATRPPRVDTPNTPRRGPLAWTPQTRHNEDTPNPRPPRMDTQTRHNEAPSSVTQTQSLLVCTDDRDARHMGTPPSLPAPTGDPQIQPIQTQLRTEMLPSLHEPENNAGGSSNPPACANQNPLAPPYLGL